MRLGRAEKAGSGVDKIVNGWKYLGWTVPTVEEATRPDYVVLTMPVENEVEKNVQENRTRKPDKKTRQERFADEGNLGILFGAKIVV